MRTLPAGALAEIAKKLGTEPINIVGVEWTGNDSITYYADRDISELQIDNSIVTIKAAILEIGEIQTSLNFANATIGTITVKLDDTDGTIKTIMNTNDIHKKPCTVYQYFGDTTLANKFSIFKGQINTPIVWSESDRTVSFSALTQIEVEEIGFSPEEAPFDFLGYDQVGQTWPLVFGSPINVPAVLTNTIANNGAILGEAMCIVDPMIAWKKEALMQAWGAMQMVILYYLSVIEAAKPIAPPPTAILNDLLVLIIMERNLFRQVNFILGRINRLNNRLKKNGRAAFIQRIKALIQRQKNRLPPIAFRLAMIANMKRVLARNAQLAVMEYEIKKQAFEKLSEAVNAQTKIYVDYINLLTIECQQQRCTKQCYAVYNGNNFELNTDVEVLINNVKFRVQFTSYSQMCLKAGPYAKYFNIPCSYAGIDQCLAGWSNLADFLIPDETVDLRGCWLLVTSKYDPTHHHIIKVVNQVGRRITFQLVGPFNDGGSSGGGSTGGSGSGLVSGATLPQALNGAFDPSGINPATGKGYTLCDSLSQEVLATLGPIALTLNQEELNYILLLQCLIPKDSAYDAFFFAAPDVRQIYTIIGEDVGEILEASGVVLGHWLDRSHNVYWEEIPDNCFWSAESGTDIVTERACQFWVANILPSTIKSVMAYRTDFISKRRMLTNVPTSYYVKNEANVLGPLTLTSLTLKAPLSSYVEEGWEDQIYVTMQSSEGPNVSDILKYLIETFTTKNVDAASFAACAAAFREPGGAHRELYPANFAIFDRRNAHDVLNEIAWQARCALILDEGTDTYYLKYLSDEPASVRTFTESDLRNLELTFDDTENLVTKMICNYRIDYLPLEHGVQPRQLILRHNVKKYWLHTKSFDFYIYDDVKLVEKSATFWMIRYANSWKKVNFDSFQTQMELQALDCVTLNFASNYVSTGSTKAIIENVSFNSAEDSIRFELWLPIRYGEMTKYKFAWPANIDAVEQFPTSLEIKKQYAGGTGIGKGITGSVPDCTN